MVNGLVPAGLALSYQGAVPAGLPSQLLERRPDVIAAERRVASSFYRTEESKAARLPAIKLTAGANSIDSSLFVLQDRNNPVWSFGAGLLVPIFTGGTLQAQVDVRTAEQKAAVASYASTGQRAFADAPAVEFLAFVGIGIAGLGITQLLLWLGVVKLHLLPELVKLAAAVVTFVFNYLVRKTLLFAASARALRTS